MAADDLPGGFTLDTPDYGDDAAGAAARGAVALGDAVSQSPIYKQATDFSGNLERYQQMVDSAIGGDKNAQMAMAQHSLGTAMGAVRFTPSGSVLGTVSNEAMQGGEAAVQRELQAQAQAFEPQAPVAHEPTSAEKVDRVKARFGDKISDKTWSKFDQASQNSNDPYLPIYQSGKTGKNLSFEPKPNSSHIGFYPNYNAKPTGQIGDLSRVEANIGNYSKMYAEDPANWLDQKYGATKSLLQKHAAEKMPATVTTTSDLIAHDDYLENLPQGSKVNLVMTQAPESGGLDRTAPSMPSNQRMMTAYQKLKDSGVDVELHYANPKTKKIEPVNPFALKALSEGRKPVGYAHGGLVNPYGGVINSNGLPAGFSLEADTASNESSAPDGFQLDEDKYGTPGQQALTAVEGGAKGLLGPIATAGESYLSHHGVPGLTPEDQAGRESANPWIHGGAQATTFIGGALAGTGEAKVLGEIGEGAAHLIPGIEKITQAKEALMAAKEAGVGVAEAEAALKAATTSIPLISRIASDGIRSGSEWAALQAGDEISKAINQDPSQSLGTAAINIGLAGIIGGAGGAVIGAVSPLFKASMEKLGLPKLIDDAKAQYEFRQGIPGGDVQTAVGEELGTRLNEVDNLRTQMSELKGASLSRAMPEITPENTAKIDAQIQGISQQMTTSIEKASDNAYLKGAVPKLAQDFQDFLKVTSNPEANYAEKFSAIDSLKRALQEKSNYSLTAEDNALGKFTKGIARDLRLSLEDPKVWGDAAEVQSKVNAAIKSSIDAEKDAAGKFTVKSNVEGGRIVDPTKVNTLVNQSLKGKAGVKTDFIQNYLDHTQKLADTINKIHTEAGLEAPIRLTPTPALDHTLGRSSPGTSLGNWLYDKGLSSVVGHTAAEATGAGLGSLVGHPVLGALVGEKMLGHVFTTMAKPLLESASHGAAFKSGMDFVVNVVKGEKILSQAAENFFKSGAEIIPKQLMPNMASREKLKQSLEYASNADNLSHVGGSLGHYLPNHATAAASSSAAAVSYFNQLKPKHIQTSPLDKPTPGNHFEESAYNRQLDIAQQPLLALEHAKKGTLQMQDLKTLNTVYPNLVPKLARSLYANMSKSLSEGHSVPYKQRIGLSMLIGQPLDSTMSQAGMQTILMANASQPEVHAPQGKTKRVSSSTAKSMDKVNQMYSTPQQSREAHRNQS